MNHRSEEQLSNVVTVSTIVSTFPATLKCEGMPQFRSSVARDFAYLLAVDPAVTSWATRPPSLAVEDRLHVADFKVMDADGVPWILDCFDQNLYELTPAIKRAACAYGYRHRVVERAELYDGYRLQNAKDLLRYANFRVSLAERVRLLAMLDDQGSLTLSECAVIVSGKYGVAVVASLVLQGLLEVDLDAAMLGPETMVRRIRP